MKEIVSISLGPARDDYELEAELRGARFRIRRFGTEGDEALALAMLRNYQLEADAIGIGRVRDHARFLVRRVIDERTARLEAAVTEAPVTTGARLREVVSEWGLRHVENTLGPIFDNARVLFVSGMDAHRLAEVMSERTPNLAFADAVHELGVPKLLTSLRALELYAAGKGRIHAHVPPRALEASEALAARFRDHVMRRALAHASVVVARVEQLAPYSLEELAGKVVLTSAVSDHDLESFRERGVELVVDLSAQALPRVVGMNVLEAMILAALDKRADELLDDELLEILDELGAVPRILHPSGHPRRTGRFAFVIHPLSQEYFKNVKPVEVLSRVAPPVFMDAIEKVLAFAPPFVYSHVTGIESPTGARAEGWLISVGGTPRELLAHSPEFTYRRLLAAAKMAKKLGAQIMGLGAFTKVVGDAGITVARRAELPITTGNSYSASAALWALNDAVRRMGLIPLDVEGKVQGKAMVVGATGSIGAVCARLLAQAVSEVHLVSPEAAKLLALKERILLDTPDARVHLATRPGDALADMDVIVTATSGAGKKILDIEKLKPGCVVTDVARPLDLPASEVRKRPDVLVIESGEILLPGEVRMRNIGLPPNVAYACLAETIVLALEGRFENFTVGRNLEWARVKEIYKLGLRHGMRLAAISGVNGVFRDEDIARVRALALRSRQAPG